MYAVCLRYSSCQEDAKDNFQDAFIKAFKNINQFSQKGSFEGWLRRIMVNQCMSNHRKKKRFLVMEEPLKLSQEELEKEEENFEEKNIDKIKSLLKCMPLQYQTVFSLYIIEEYSHAEIAKELEISINTSKSNLSRAKAWLRKELKKQEKA